MDMTWEPARLEARGLMDVSLNLSDSRAGALTSISLQFTTWLKVPAGARLLLCLPPDFDTSAASLRNLSFSGGSYLASGALGVANGGPGCLLIYCVFCGSPDDMSPAGPHSAVLDGVRVGARPPCAVPTLAGINASRHQRYQAPTLQDNTRARAGDAGLRSYGRAARPVR
eukprot:292678-Prymnesium_polylepis.1